MRTWIKAIVHTFLLTALTTGWRPVWAQGPQISFSLPNNTTVYTAEAQITVTICSEVWLQSYGATHTSSNGTYAVQLEDGPWANCPNGGSAYYANLTLLPGWNTLFVDATDGWYNYSSNSLYINYYVEPQVEYHVKVTAPGQGGVRVTPGTTQVFPIVFTNVGQPASDYSVTVSCTGGFTNCRKVSGSSSFTTGNIASLGSRTIDIEATASSVSGGSGTIRVIAVSTQSATNPDTATTTLIMTNTAQPAPLVGRMLDTLHVASASGAKAASFLVTNPDGLSSRTLSLTATCGSPLTSCGVSPSSLTLGAQRDSLVNLTFNVPSSSATPKVVLTVTPSGNPGQARKDSTWVKIGAVPAAVVTVNATAHNPGTSIARDQCLSIAAGDAAGVECGTLRLAHGMPAIRTMDRDRAPTLLYSSHTAHPMVLLAAQVSARNLPATDSLRATLLVGGHTLTHKWPWSPACAAAAGCRIVMPVNADSLGLPTGTYAYTLQVRIGAGGSPPLGQQSGTFALVNDRQSAFGAGWWLEGLERLQPIPGSQNFLWIGGDGSTRVYVNRSATVWTVQDQVSRPDTLIRNGSLYERRLRNGGRVVFDAAYRHSATVNRQGHVTSFVYDLTYGVLAYVVLPKASAGGPERRFDFTYSTSGATRLSAVIPKANGAVIAGRSLLVTVDGSQRLTEIRDPDSTVVRFLYPSSGATRRVAGRVNRLSDTTLYAYDAFGAVTSVTVKMRTDPAITSTLCPAETRSLVSCAGDGAVATPMLPSRVVTRLDGPRSDVADVTRFHVGRFGAPDTLVDAMGGRTRLERNLASFPALVTAMTDAAGLRTRTVYNSRGLPDSIIVVDPLATGADAITTIDWHTQWDMAVMTKAPTGEIDHIGIDAGTGNRLWQQRGGGDSTRVTFGYDTRNRLLTIANTEGVLTRYVYGDSVTTLGNRWKTVGTRSDTVTVLGDVMGLDSVTWTPTDSAGAPSSWTRQVLVRDRMGRVLHDSTFAAPRAWTITSESGLSLQGTSPTRVALVESTYDLEGSPLMVYRSTPPLHSGETFLLSTSAMSTWTYDAAKRVRTATTTGGTETHYYDPAGNRIRTTTKRGLNVTQQFDALGRVVSRTTPGVRLTQFTCSDCAQDPAWNLNPTRFPYFGTRLSDNAVSPDAVVETETAFFAYDAAGRLVQADNPYALVRRAYFPNGALKSDTSIARVYDQDAYNLFPSTFRTVLNYTYDLSGRRLTRSDIWGGLQTYAYDALGQLSTSADRATGGGTSIAVNFAYDPHGRLRTQSVPSAGVTSTWTYDLSGQPITRVETTANDGVAGYADQIQYDARGKRIRVIGRPLYAGGATEEFVSAYDGFGHLVASGFGGGAVPTMDEMVVDGHGFVHARHSNRQSSFDGTEQLRQSQYSNDRLQATIGVPRPENRGHWSGVGPAVREIDSLVVSYDGSGNVGWQRSIRLEWQVISGNNDTFLRAATGSKWSAFLYDADERLRFSQVAQLDPGPPNTLPKATQSEYWYDALGRRILVRTRVDSTSCGSSQVSGNPYACQQSVVRTVWDGDQILKETRRLGGWQLLDSQVDGGGGSGAFFGTVRTMQTGAIDVPLLIWRDDANPRVLHRNWRGNVGGATLVSSPSTVDQATLWPAALTDIQLAPDARKDGQGGTPIPTGWWGALVDDQKDPTGLLYRRNRYYDPQTGRFTQEDPIGLAGGLNLYGFADGDPINSSDPFGLLPVLPGFGARVSRGFFAELRRDIEASVARFAESVAGAISESAIGAGLAKIGATAGSTRLYRGGAANPGNLTPRARESGLSVRTSLSNPIDSKAAPVFPPGVKVTEIDAARLPPGSVHVDNVPPGHAEIRNATAEQVKSAVTTTIKLP